jgi:hypothetical protein
MKRWWLSLIAVALLVWPLGLAHARGGGGGPRGPAAAGSMTCPVNRPGQCSGMQERLRLRDGSCQGERTREQQQSREQDREQLREQDQERSRQGGDL